MSMEDENEKEKEKEKETETSSLRRGTRHRRSSSVSCFLSSTSNQISHDSSSSKKSHHHFPEIKGKCRNIMNRFGRHRRHASEDLSYDQISYAKNFEDNNETNFDDTEDFPNFMARLPSSPPNSKVIIPTNISKHE